MLYPQKYVPAVTVVKGIVGGMGIGSVGILIAWALDAATTGNFEMTAVQSAALAAVAGAVWVAVKNFAKVKLGWNWLPVLACVAMLQGCVTAGGGKGKMDEPAILNTTIETQQPATIDPVTGAIIPGERYYAKIEKSLPAGTDLEGQDNLHFGIAEDGYWDITLGQNAGYSSQGQMQGLIEYSKVNAQLQRDQQAQAWGSIMPFLSLIAPEAAALIGKRMDLGAVDDARDDANKAQRDTQILQFLEGLSKRLSKLEKPADSPLVDVPVTLPEVGTN